MLRFGPVNPFGQLDSARRGGKLRGSWLKWLNGSSSAPASTLAALGPSGSTSIIQKYFANVRCRTRPNRKRPKTEIPANWGKRNSWNDGPTRIFGQLNCGLEMLTVCLLGHLWMDRWMDGWLVGCLEQDDYDFWTTFQLTADALVVQTLVFSLLFFSHYPESGPLKKFLSSSLFFCEKQWICWNSLNGIWKIIRAVQHRDMQFTNNAAIKNAFGNAFEAQIRLLAGTTNVLHIILLSRLVNWNWFQIQVHCPMHYSYLYILYNYIYVV